MGFFGKKHSDETKLKLSAAKKGKRMSDETKLKISAAKKGKRMSDESKLQNTSLQKLGPVFPRLGPVPIMRLQAQT